MDKQNIEVEARNSFHTVASTVDICDVISKLVKEDVVQCGVDTYELDSKECPFCNHLDCFRVNMGEDKPYFKCFSCEKSGDVTSFVSSYRKLSPKESLNFILENKYSELDPLSHQVIPAEKGNAVPNEAVQKIFNSAASYYESQLSQKKEAYAFQLSDRGHKFETLDKFKVGFADGKLFSHLQSLGFADEDIIESGLVKSNGRDFFIKDNFIYPHINENGDICRFSIKPFRHKVLYQLSKKHWLKDTLFYGENTLVKSKRLLIVEGENDLLSVIDSGWDEGVIATIGQLKSAQLEWIKENQEDYQIISCFDEDDAGNNYRIKLRKGNISHSEIASYDGCKDIDEYLSKGGNLKKLLESALDICTTKTISFPNFNYEDIEPVFNQCTDVRNAERLSKICHGQAKYISDVGRWAVYNGVKWELCDVAPVFEAAKLVPKLINLEAHSLPFYDSPNSESEKSANKLRDNHLKQALKAEQITSIKNAITAFQTMPNIASTLNNFDSESHLIGLQNGVLNLGSGELYEASPDFLITKSCNANFDREAEAPTFLSFLKTALSTYSENEQQELIDYLQRFAGASLHGEVSDRAFHFLFGKSGTGKSVFTNTMLQILGDYAHSLSPESLMDRLKGGEARSDLLAIKGARLVVAPEVPQKSKLNEELMKRLTSAGDTLTVRPLYGSPVCFIPQATIILTGNHKPAITSGSDATWQRMRLFEFMHQIPRSEQDKELSRKLALEADGIFNWAYEGFIKWKNEGLTPPPVMERLTREYQDEQSYMQNFIDDCCEHDSDNTIEVEVLWREYDEWSSKVKYGGMSRKSFLTMVQEQGFSVIRTKNCDHYIDKKNQYRAIKGLALRVSGTSYPFQDYNI